MNELKHFIYHVGSYLGVYILIQLYRYTETFEDAVLIALAFIVVDTTITRIEIERKK